MTQTFMLAAAKALQTSMPPEEIRAIMGELGCTSHDKFAQMIGVTHSTISMWLSGRVGVPRPVAMLLRMMVETA